MDVAAITVRNIDDKVRDRLRTRAAANGRSMEAEVRAILTDAVETPAPDRLGTRIHVRFGRSSGTADLVLPVRTEGPRPVDLPR